MIVEPAGEEEIVLVDLEADLQIGIDGDTVTGVEADLALLDVGLHRDEVIEVGVEDGPVNLHVFFVYLPERDQITEVEAFCFRRHERSPAAFPA